MSLGASDAVRKSQIGFVISAAVMVLVGLGPF